MLLAGVAGFRNVGHNASASLLRRWVSDNTFTWLISEEILDEYKEVLARQKVRRELIGRIINLLREEASLVPVKRLRRFHRIRGTILSALVHADNQVSEMQGKDCER